MPPKPTGDHPVRKRAKKACIACNTRRVRCDVVERHPCQNCASMNIPCEIGVSKRGKYPRHKRASTPRSVESPLLTPETQRNAVPGSADIGSQSGNVNSNDSRAINTPLAHAVPKRELHNSAEPTVFLGESSPLTCVVDEGHRSPERGSATRPHGSRLRYSIPMSQDTPDARDDFLRERRKDIEERLTGQGTFLVPDNTTSAILLNAYFTWFHPCYPILDRAATYESYANQTVPQLLRQAMCFIGISLCTDEEFVKTGFEDRYRTKFLFYSRAKAIFDAELESNVIVKLQSLFLLSFWRGRPSEERDTRFWLGIAIDIAQKRGVHVLSKLPCHDPNERKILKIIWWVLYMRDQQTSAALGLPSRIHDEDCNVPRLMPSDLTETSVVPDTSTFGKQQEHHILYLIEMVELSKILRYIISIIYSPTQSMQVDHMRALVQRLLTTWESGLAPELKLENARTKDKLFLVGMLHMAYNNLYILLYRSSFVHSPGDSMEAEGHIALERASTNTRILEDMLSQSLVQHGSLHMITHVFSSLCIQTIHFCRTTGTSKSLAEHRAKLCLLGLRELQKSWDLKNWVLDLFFRCIDDNTARNLRLPDTAANPNSPVSNAIRNIQNLEHTEPLGSASSPSNMVTGNDPTLGLGTPGSLLQTPQARPSMDVTADIEWPGFFNFSDDFADVLGVSPTNPDSVNPQNLAFLYRFL